MLAECGVEGCDTPRHPKAGFGMCGLHYRRKRKTGDPGQGFLPRDCRQCLIAYIPTVIGNRYCETCALSRIPDLPTCNVCGSRMEGRSDRETCSKECKLLAKRKYDREHYLLNQDEALARAKAWQASNFKRKKEYDARYRSLNFETLARNKQAWSKENPRPEKARIRQYRRRARKVGNGSFLVTNKDLRSSLHRHQNRCAYCHQHLGGEIRLEWDHVVPISRGGQNSIGNLLPSCSACNRSKSARFVIEWRTGRVRANSRERVSR